MDPIQPIQPIQPLHNVEDVHPLHPYYPAHTVAPSVEAQTIGSTTIDHARLKQDQDYFLQTLNNLLYEARAAYNGFNYAEAKGIYEQYFRFLGYYGNTTYSQSQVNFYPAMFEYSWTMEIEGHREEAQRFFNLQLLQVLNAPLQTKKPELHPVQETIKTLQQQQILPSPTNLKVNVPQEQLLNLAQQLVAAGNRPIAIQILHLAEIESLLGLARAGKQIHGLEAQTSTQSIPSQQLPSPFEHWGIPIAPYMPISSDARAVLQSKVYRPEYHPDRVDPIQPINKDPRDFDRRWRQQKKKPATAKKSSRVNPKPGIHFPTI